MKILLIVAGIIAISVGVTGFSDKGLPLTKEKRITGVAGHVVGTICIVVGVVILLYSIGVPLPFSDYL